jgi:hypothetical protein
MQICLNSPSTPEPTLSWYDLSAEVKRLLIAATDTWEDTERSQEYIHQAVAISDRSLDVFVAAYRYFFYKHNDAVALQMARGAIEQVKLLEKLPEDWEELAPILSSRKEEYNIRLYLNAYSASGLILARLGAIEEAKTIATRVNDIDNKREFGAATVLSILTNSENEEED